MRVHTDEQLRRVPQEVGVPARRRLDNELGVEHDVPDEDQEAAVLRWGGQGEARENGYGASFPRSPRTRLKRNMASVR